MKKTKEEIVENLKEVSTTTGLNGYPQNVGYAYTSDSIQELLDVIDELEENGHEYTLLELHKREGQGLWNRVSIPFIKKGEYMTPNEQDTYFDFDPKLSEEETKEQLFDLLGKDEFESYAIMEACKDAIDELYEEMSGETEPTRFFLSDEYKIDYSVSDDAAGYRYDTHHNQLAISC